jgi:hypothetical protein
MTQLWGGVRGFYIHFFQTISQNKPRATCFVAVWGQLGRQNAKRFVLPHIACAAKVNILKKLLNQVAYFYDYQL